MQGGIKGAGGRGRGGTLQIIIYIYIYIIYIYITGESWKYTRRQFSKPAPCITCVGVSADC